MYSVEFKSQAAKSIRTLPKNIQKRILKKIEALQQDPFPHNSQRLHEHPNLYKIRYSSYRVVYHVEPDKTHIIITKIGHRRDVYNSL